jgi:anti-anti-sigma factor
MGDDRLRSLERDWRETASPEAERAWELERRRRGLPARVMIVDLSVETYTPGLDAPEVEIGNTGPQDLEAVVSEVLDCGLEPWLICDSSRLNYFQSRNLATLVAAQRPLQKEGGGLVLCGVQPRVQLVFELLGLLSVFAFSDSVEACLSERHWQARGERLSAVFLAVM